VTTIAVSLPMLTMAADSRAMIWERKGRALRESHAVKCYKLVRTRKYIIGCAGDSNDIAEFLRWTREPLTRRRRTKDDFQAVLLSRTGLWWVDENGPLEVCRTPFYAIGSGSGYAMAAFSAMQRLGAEINPTIAVEVACEHDKNSAPPVDSMRWKPSK